MVLCLKYDYIDGGIIMWECDVCGYLNDDYDDVCEQCWAVRGVNNFMDWSDEA